MKWQRAKWLGGADALPSSAEPRLVWVESGPPITANWPGLPDEYGRGYLTHLVDPEGRRVFADHGKIELLPVFANDVQPEVWRP